MSWTRILIAIIASVWFFPVNCTGTLFAGTFLVANLDAREVEKGESVHPLFSFIVESRESSEPILAVKLSELPNFKQKMANMGATDNYSFVMSRPDGRITLNNSIISYQVIEETTSEQVIEVIEHYQDGDNTIWSRYKATQSGVTPISSRMFYFGYMFGAFPYAFGFALFVYGVGRFLKHRNQVSEVPDGDS